MTTPTAPGSGRKRPRINLVEMYEAAQASAGPASFAASNTVASEAQAAPPAFNPEAYLSNILRTQSLKELLETDSTMIKDIKDLENNMKELVYANYSKFITASTTIHQMRGKVDSMEGEMKKLAENVDRIANTSDRISGTLQANTQLIDQLSGVHHLLQKLQFLVELPARLSSSIKAGRYEEAVTYYRKTRTVLDKYKNVASFSPIEKQSTEIISNLTKLLSEKFYEKNVNYENLSSYASLLLDLDQPLPEIRAQFSKVRIIQLNEILAPFKSCPIVEVPDEEPQPGNPNPFKTPTGTYSPATASATILALNRAIKEAAIEFVSTFARLFIERKGTTKNEQLNSIFLLEDSTIALIQSYCDVVYQYVLKFADQGSASNVIVKEDGTRQTPPSEALLASCQYLDAMIDTYWGQALLSTTAAENIPKIKANTKLKQSSEYVNSVLSGLLVLGFSDIQKQVMSVIKEGMEKVFNSLSPLDQVSSDLPSTSSDSTSSILNDDLKNIVGNSASSSPLSNTQEIVHTTNDAVESITSGIVSSLDSSFGSKISVLFELCAPGSFLESLAPSLLATIQTNVQSLIAAIVEQFSSLATSESSNQAASSNITASGSMITTSRPLLVAPIVFEALQNKALPSLASTLARTISSTHNLNLDTATAQSNILTLGSDLQAASLRLISLHVRRSGMVLGRMLKNSVQSTNWFKHPEPKGVGDSIDHFLDELDHIVKPICILYEAGARKQRKRILIGSAGADSKLSVANDIEYDSLFQKKVSYFDKVEFNARSIITAIIKIALKTYLEIVRLQTFGTYGYQQIQLDVGYLNLALDTNASDPVALDSMMLDVLNAAKERCMQPSSMDTAVIQHILKSKPLKPNFVDSMTPSTPISLSSTIAASPSSTNFTSTHVISASSSSTNLSTPSRSSLSGL